MPKKTPSTIKLAVSGFPNNGVRKFKVAQEVQRIEDAKRKEIIRAAKDIKNLSPKSNSTDRVFEVIDNCSAFDEKERRYLKQLYAQSPQDLIDRMLEKAQEATDFLERSEISAYERFLKSRPNPDEICAVVMQLASTTRKHLLEVFEKSKTIPIKQKLRCLCLFERAMA